MSQSRAVERRTLLRGAGVAGAAVVGAASVPVEAVAEGRPSGAAGLLGGWRITHTDDPPGNTTPVAGVVTFGAGGAFAAQDIAPVTPGGLGSWHARGDRFEVVFWSGENGDDPAAPGVTLRVHVHGRRHADRIHGSYRVTIYAGASTTVLQRGTGTFSGWRVEL